MENSSEITTDQLEQIQRKAETLLGSMKAEPWERPLFVEFSGSPKSGKSTLIEIVTHFFRRMGFKILIPSEGASKRIPHYLKDDLVAFNTWSMCYTLSHLLEGLYHSDKYQIAILDRGLFDALVWFEFLANRNAISKEERMQIHSFILIEKWRSVIDLVFLLKADPDTSLNRESQDKLISGYGRAMNPYFLRELNEAYDIVCSRYASNFVNFESIDTSNHNAVSLKVTAYHIVDRILTLSPTNLKLLHF
jgi:thymidylate kinase